MEEQKGVALSDGTNPYLNGAGIDAPLRLNNGSANSYYLGNQLGSITHLSDSSGSSSGNYQYLPYGAQLTSSSPVSGNPFTYTAREDDGTGLLYYRARYYDPTLQTFISQDPLGDAQRYAGGNPLSFVDPLGLCKIDVEFNPLAFGKYHAYVVTTSPTGLQSIYRAGPLTQPAPSLSLMSRASTGAAAYKVGSGTVSGPGVWGTLTAISSFYMPGGPDWNALPHPGINILDDDAPCDCEKSFDAYIQHANSQSIRYNPLSTNSNAFVSNMLRYAGYSVPPPPVSAPGWNTKLP